MAVLEKILLWLMSYLYNISYNHTTTIYKLYFTTDSMFVVTISCTNVNDIVKLFATITNYKLYFGDHYPSGANQMVFATLYSIGKLIKILCTNDEKVHDDDEELSR